MVYNKEFIERWSIPKPNTGCWLWLGWLTSTGYGFYGANGLSVIAHRVAYEVFVGPIPDGLEIDHKCQMRCCVNPRHLEPVTRTENVRRYRERNWPDSKCKFRASS